ncbi:hypothetical protein [Kitasatospora cheerisanensis]|uniref:Uncharacterized protein n=1 Tax=Kitasatospora cheerisanensis KCTC 2395 TaxID=1348663 RepID=A0A066Z3R3_9ACTN|nr:hypothetical protein [Kitasatospora cheerisanensis]KDN84790.1 hypothetical protein KCH_33170 [Kitasatospora cheerisanensis KCTC 2395]
MTDHARIRGLLEQALVEPPAVADHRSPFARAARIRRRRRAGLGLAAAGLLAAALLVQGPGAPRPPSAPDRPERQQARRLEALLPAAVGAVELAVPLPGPAGGPLDGVYWIRKDGRLGVIRIETGPATSAPLSCTPELPGATGRICEDRAIRPRTGLTVDQRPEPDGAVELAWGSSVDAVLPLPDGRALFVDAISGYRGRRAPGPAMDAPPLTADRLRELVRRSELVAGV